MARVAVSWINGHKDQGGSTIDQQLAKNLYTGGHSGLTRDLEQLAIAVKLSQTYSRAAILRMYAEVAYYGHGYYGLEAASCGYFGRLPDRRNLVQAATLAGVVNAPSYDDPLVHPQQARSLLVHVIGRMAAVGYLTQAQQAAALNAPLGLPPSAAARDQAPEVSGCSCSATRVVRLKEYPAAVAVQPEHGGDADADDVRHVVGERVRQAEPVVHGRDEASWMSSPIPLKTKNRTDSRPRWLPLRCRNAQNLLPRKANTVATQVAIVTEVSGPSPAPERSALAPPMVMKKARTPTMPNLATSWISTLNRV